MPQLTMDDPREIVSQWTRWRRIGNCLLILTRNQGFEYANAKIAREGRCARLCQEKLGRLYVNADPRVAYIMMQSPWHSQADRQDLSHRGADAKPLGRSASRREGGASGAGWNGEYGKGCRGEWVAESSRRFLTISAA